MLEKAKKALDAKEASVKGKSWLSEVKEDDGNWKDLEGWKASYNPPKKEKKEDSAAKKEKKENAKAKALELAFRKIQTGISKQILTIMLEVASTLLGKTAAVAASMDSVPLSKLLSSVNAVVLSYRFDTSKKNNASTRKFAFLRQEACAEFTAAVYELLPQGQGPAPVTADIRKLLEDQKAFTKALLMQQIDALLGKASDKVDEKCMEAEAIEVTAVNTAKDKLGADKINVIIKKTQGELAKVGLSADDAVPDFKSQVTTQKDDLIANFGAMFKDLLLSKMETLGETLNKYVEEVLAVLEAVMKTSDMKNTKSLPALTKEMMVVVDLKYNEVKETISAEVQKVLDMLSAIVASKSGDEEDKDRDEEE